LDIINLSDSIRASVREKFQIELTPEVNLIFG
jgi:UDP-N-acetylenolpyruvoylglucosamine reductase